MLTEDAIPVLYFIPQQLGYIYILHKTQIIDMYERMKKNVNCSTSEMFIVNHVFLAIFSLQGNGI